MDIAINIIVLLIAVILHEIAHGYVANLYGDPTAKNLGRLSLNPVSHIDPVGSLLIPGLLFVTGAPFLIGWAKPVPVNPRYFHNPIKDMMWVALAGPLVNFSLAVIASIGLKLSPLFASSIVFYDLFCYTCIVTIYINILLGIFNLFPIPPLDGSRILRAFVSPSIGYKLDRIEPYGFLIIFALFYIGVFSQVLFPLSEFFIRWLI